MATNPTIKCNFTNVFAKLNTEAEINDIANSIVAQLKEAHQARLKEITSTASEDDVMVEIETETPQPKPKKTDKTAKAKEVAKKLKDKKTAPAKTESEPKAKESKEVLLAITDKAEIKKLGLTFEKYNDRCYVLRGDTKPLRKVLKEEYKGVFNSRLSGGEGWVISNSKVEECAKGLGLKVKTA